ncbi:MAG: 2-keto-4-pentenoate hydratase, partial [Bacillariaceae sp.]
ATTTTAYNAAAAAAATYMTAWSSGQFISDPMKLPPPPKSLEEIYATHDFMTSFATTDCNNFGGGIGGYKMGAVGLLDNVPCLYAPLFQDYIYNDDDSSSSFSPSISELNCHTLEAEIGFIIGKDLPPKKKKGEEELLDYTEDEIISAIESVVCCVELVCSRAIGDAWKEMPLKSKLADCVMTGGVLVGEKLTTTTFNADSIRKIKTSFIVDGKVQDEGCADVCPQGGPIESLTWLVHTLNSKDCGLKKGQLVISGMTSKIGSPDVENNIEVTFDTNNDDDPSSIQFSFKE